MDLAARSNSKDMDDNETNTRHEWSGSALRDIIIKYGDIKWIDVSFNSRKLVASKEEC